MSAILALPWRFVHLASGSDEHNRDQDIARSREDPRSSRSGGKSLEQLLGSLHRMQNATPLGPEMTRELRKGAQVAVQLADRIRAIDEHAELAETRAQ